MKLKPKFGVHEGKDFMYFHKRFEVPMFGWYITIVYTTSIRGARSLPEFVNKLGNDSRPNSSAFAFCETQPSLLRTFIFLPLGQNPFRFCSEATVAHECLHAAWVILKTAGIKIDDEILAYVLEYIMNHIVKFSHGIVDCVNEVDKAKKKLDKKSKK